MKTLNEIEITQISILCKYFVVSTFEDNSEMEEGLYGTGEEVIEYLKEVFEHANWIKDLEDNEDPSLNSFLLWVKSVNGDGYDNIRIYVMPEVNTKLIALAPEMLKYLMNEKIYLETIIALNEEFKNKEENTEALYNTNRLDNLSKLLKKITE